MRKKHDAASSTQLREWNHLKMIFDEEDRLRVLSGSFQPGHTK